MNIFPIFAKKVLALTIPFVLATCAFSQTKKPRPRAPKEVFVLKNAPAPQKKENKAKTTAEQPKTFGVVLERYVNNIEVNKNGTSTQKWEILQRFDSDLAIRTFSKMEKIFNKDLEEIDVSDAYVLKADGRKIPVPADAIKIRPTPQAEAAPSFSSLMVLELAFSGLTTGDTVHYVLTLRTKKTYFEGEFDRLDYLASVFDWNSAEINLTAPDDYPLQIEAIGLDGGRLPDAGDNKVRWKWRKENLKALELEELMLDVISSSPRIAITSFENYDALGAAYWAEAQKKAVLTPEIQALADEITKNSKTSEQQAYDIYQWVNKNIRYLSIVLDRGGWIPHNSSEILANRYGDCKDYTTVLHSLLQAKNIESYPVIIRSDLSTWFPSVAVPAFFNHAILYIPSLDLFADATAENTRLGLIPQTLVGKKGFLAGKKRGVIETPSDRPDDNQLLSSTEITVLPDGTLKAVSKNTYHGRSEILFRPMFSESSVRNQSETFVSVMLSFFGLTGTGRILNIGNPFKVGEPFNVDLEVLLNGYTSIQPKGSFRMPVAVNLNNILALEMFSKAEKRTTSLSLGASKFREEYLISFPQGVTPNDAPPGVDFSNAVGSFRKEAAIEGDKVRIVRELVVKKDVVPVEQYALIRDLISKMVANYDIEIKYTSTAAAIATLVAKTNRNPRADRYGSPFGLPDFLEEKKITAAEALRLEKKLLSDPDNLEARRSLVRHYSAFQRKETPARANARIRHYRWFIENHSEMDEIAILGPYLAPRTSNEADFNALKPAWLAVLEKNKNNAEIRLNAFEFFKMWEPATAEKLLVEGTKIDTEDYRFALTLSNTYNKKLDDLKPESVNEQRERKKKELMYGIEAVTLLKKERSDERHELRKRLLQNLAQTAYELSDFQSAKALATELILDFGQDSKDVNYDSASHIGNIVLGRTALKENDKTKAAEYLLIAIRAPLRKEKSWLPDIDTALAKELLAAGEKNAVLEYLQLCENLWNLKNEKDLFDYQTKALKKWREQIKRGETPSFDFGKP